MWKPWNQHSAERCISIRSLAFLMAIRVGTCLLYEPLCCIRQWWRINKWNKRLISYSHRLKILNSHNEVSHIHQRGEGMGTTPILVRTWNTRVCASARRSNDHSWMIIHIIIKSYNHVQGETQRTQVANFIYCEWRSAFLPMALDAHVPTTQNTVIEYIHRVPGNS